MRKMRENMEVPMARMTTARRTENKQKRAMKTAVKARRPRDWKTENAVFTIAPGQIEFVMGGKTQTFNRKPELRRLKGMIDYALEAQ